MSICADCQLIRWVGAVIEIYILIELQRNHTNTITICVGNEFNGMKWRQSIYLFCKIRLTWIRCIRWALFLWRKNALQFLLEFFSKRTLFEQNYNFRFGNFNAGKRWKRIAPWLLMIYCFRFSFNQSFVILKQTVRTIWSGFGGF
jgi:hypothetical protein